MSVFGARSSVVVKALWYKAEAALGPGVYSASNRKEYQKQKNNKVRLVRRADKLTAISRPIV
jgi:hypothetical protein